MKSDRAPVPNEIRSGAAYFVRHEAGFAQIVTLSADGYPIGRTASAFLRDDWSVDLIQRRQHRRITQLRRRPHTLIIWTGTPAVESTNNFPAVFDLDLTIPRAVFLRGDAEPLDADQAWAAYSEHHRRLVRRGHTKAPDRDRTAADAELRGFRIRPRQIRVEGFGSAAQAYDWTIEGAR